MDSNGCHKCGRSVNYICFRHKKCLTCHSLIELRHHQTNDKAKEVPTLYAKRIVDNINYWGKREL